MEAMVISGKGGVYPHRTGTVTSLADSRELSQVLNKGYYKTDI